MDKQRFVELDNRDINRLTGTNKRALYLSLWALFKRVVDSLTRSLTSDIAHSSKV